MLKGILSGLNPENIKTTARKLRDPKYLQRQWFRFRSYLGLYGGVLLLLVFMYHFLSDKNYSFLLTCGSFIRMVGFVMLFAHIWRKKSCAGISLKCMELFLVVFAARLCSVLINEGYLPFDRSGDWLYQVLEISSLLSVLLIMFLMTRKFSDSYEERLDVFGSLPFLPAKLGALAALLPAGLLAALFHPSLNNYWLTDIAWTLALYTEAVAFFPQVIMFHRKGGEIESVTANYVFCLGLARFLHFVFWVGSYSELNDRYNPTTTGQYIGYGVLIAQLIQLGLMGDFFYFYLRAMRHGGPMTLPLSNMS